MNIPTLFNTKMVDSQGYLNPDWYNLFQQLFTQMQLNLSNNGYQLPQQSAANISNIQASFANTPNPSLYYGDILYNTTNDTAMVNIAGTFKTITVS